MTIHINLSNPTPISSYHSYNIFQASVLYLTNFPPFSISASSYRSFMLSVHVPTSKFPLCYTMPRYEAPRQDESHLPSINKHSLEKLARHATSEFYFAFAPREGSRMVFFFLHIFHHHRVNYHMFLLFSHLFSNYFHSFHSHVTFVHLNIDSLEQKPLY